MMEGVARWGVMAALGGLMLAGPASACPMEVPGLIFHSCWGTAEFEVLLLPEEEATPPDSANSITVTGAYTGKDARAGGAPNPVGLFIDGGEVINPNLARMDGVLVVRGTEPSIHHRERVAFDGRVWDLNDVDTRQRFAESIQKDGASVIQSHLLLTDGALDVRQQDDAPVAIRRLLFTDAHGFGLYQTALPVTLFAAASSTLDLLSPDMALNLDMGSFDYCIAIEDGQTTNCGVLAPGDVDKLSNLLRLTLSPAS